MKQSKAGLGFCVKLITVFWLGILTGSLHTGLFVKQTTLARLTVTSTHADADPAVVHKPIESIGRGHKHHPGAEHAESCWQCVKAEWRRHFVFANSTGGYLDACPNTTDWPPGVWSQQISDSQDNTLRHPYFNEFQLGAKAAALGEAAALPGTLLAQHAIWQNQHPKDCMRAKFIIYRPVSSGISSMLHSEAAAFSAAMETGRVFLEAPGHPLAATPYCGVDQTLDSCYFLPLSNCTLQQAGITSQELARAPLASLQQLQQYSAVDPTSPRVIAMGHAQAASVRALTPSVFRSVLNTAGLPQARRYWWWRAQAIAFIVRPNARTRGEIAIRRRQKLKGKPLREGCISLYVRHGDKHVEAKVWDDAAYDLALSKLRSYDTSLTHQLFLSTEDPVTVEYFTSASRNWSTTVIAMKRKPDSSRSNLAYMAEHGYSEEMLDCLLNLDHSLSCDGFVASFYSDWARLIEELRATVRCKAHKVFLDVGTELMQDQRFGGLDLNW